MQTLTIEELQAKKDRHVASAWKNNQSDLRAFEQRLEMLVETGDTSSAGYYNRLEPVEALRAEKARIEAELARRGLTINKYGDLVK